MGISDTLSSDLSLAHHPITPTAVNFNTTFSTQTPTGESYLAEAPSGGINSGNAVIKPVVNGNAMIDVNGQPAWYLEGDGFPASTPILAVEYICHLEGVPNVASGLRASASSVGAGSQSLLQNILSRFTMDDLMYAVKTGSNFFFSKPRVPRIEL